MKSKYDILILEREEKLDVPTSKRYTIKYTCLRRIGREGYNGMREEPLRITASFKHYRSSFIQLQRDIIKYEEDINVMSQSICTLALVFGKFIYPVKRYKSI